MGNNWHKNNNLSLDNSFAGLICQQFESRMLRLFIFLHVQRESTFISEINHSSTAHTAHKQATSMWFSPPLSLQCRISIKIGVFNPTISCITYKHDTDRFTGIFLCLVDFLPQCSRHHSQIFKSIRPFHVVIRFDMAPAFSSWQTSVSYFFVFLPHTITSCPASQPRKYGGHNVHTILSVHVSSYEYTRHL